LIDPVFNLLIFLGVYYLLSLSFDVEFIKDKLARRMRLRHAFLSGFFIGLAVLTKGPVALLLQVLAGLTYYAITRGKKIFNRYEFLMWFIALVFVTSFWYGLQFLMHGEWIIREFIRYQVRLFSTADAGHAGPFYYHFLVVLIGCFPASIYVFNAFRKYSSDNLNQIIIKRWMIALLVVVLVVFSIVKTKIVHYSSLSYFPLTFLATYVLHKMINREIKWSWLHLSLYLLVGFIWGTAMILTPYAGLHPELIQSLLQDPFAEANLNAAVYWHPAEMMIGVFFLLGLLGTTYLFWIRRYTIGLSLSFILTALALQVIMTLFVPKIERYSQRAALEMFEELADQDVYLNVVGYKSYAHYFYGRKHDQLAENTRFKNWLQLQGKAFDELISPELIELEKQWHLSGNIDKPAYLMTKIHRAEQFKSRFQLQEVYRKNGFVLLKRDIPASKD
jgi:4-amino-4-deoxy-L-arabinose transferase-like glycosyltransferase